jgi:transcriptional regulator with GAF, ATPase, and Fis domain
VPADPVSAALAELSRFNVSDSTVAQTLDRIAAITLEAIPGAAVAGMSMLDDAGRPTTGIYTDDDSPEIDAAQYREGKGPCLDAWRQQQVIRLDNFDTAAERYPGFVRACLEHEVRSTLSLPLVSGDTGIGALNLYAREPESFTSQDESVGATLAATAAVVLSNVSAYWTAFELSQNLTEAMKTRAAIEQAKGMLMARDQNLTPDAAFDLLRRASQRENVKLNELARRLVERQPPPSTGQHPRAAALTGNARAGGSGGS